VSDATSNMAIVNDETSIVENVIVVDENTFVKSAEEELVGPGYSGVHVTEATGPAYIGGEWNGTTFAPPPPLEAEQLPAPPPSGPSVEDRLAALEARLGKQ